MAVTAHFYNSFFTALAQGKINLTSDTLKLALVGSGYTPNQAADQFWSTPQAYEISGPGYTAGGCGDRVDRNHPSRLGFHRRQRAMVQRHILRVQGSALRRQNRLSRNRSADRLGRLRRVQSPSNGVFAVNWSADGIGVITPA
ncbi:hypothetical protein [Mycobacterium botniense]|uniref:Uncharacterized protein n=1 Tax=Mycobacterium botniense TaxID=84962 RepID=A0A7I9XXZ8_9MYCO|nr:hypothetical protein [Mycobacterium botniense]GFG74679.1 hypothetical protein MBOT_20440 [Mycobacterium botniense]